MRTLVTRLFTALVLCLFASACCRISPEPPEPPDSPAGKILGAWLAAFNSGDLQKMRAFDEAYGQMAAPAEEAIDLSKRTGGFALWYVEAYEPFSLLAGLREKNADEGSVLELYVSPAEEPKIVRASLRAVTYPELPTTQAGALEALSAYAEEEAKNDRFSGAVLVARRGEILLRKGWGRANRETGAPVTPETRFRIGSMNKMFTAIATLQLVEEGKLALADTVGKHLPDYPNKEVASKVTVRHLLTHTGGTGDIFGPEFVRHRTTLREHRDYLDLYGSRGLVFGPDQGFTYSNYGFVLLGALIEKVSGKSYYEYVRSRIFQPAGMKSTDSLPESDEVPGRAVGYMRRRAAWEPNTDTLPYRGTAAGGGYSTVDDLLRFAQALESGKLLSKAMFAGATRPRFENYGYGFEVRGEGSLRRYGHSGGAPGMNGDLRIYPQLGYVFVSLSNLDPPAASRVLDYFGPDYL